MLGTQKGDQLLLSKKALFALSPFKVCAVAPSRKCEGHLDCCLGEDVRAVCDVYG